MIYPICTDKIKYILKEGYEGKKMKDELQISQCKLSNVLLVGFNNLTIRNDCGKNKDHRGSNHCNIYLPMHDKVVMTKFATLYDLAIAYYRLKSHKWDRWYELFSYAMPVRKKNDIIVNLVFDHGS